MRRVSENILLTFWVGGIWAVGYIVAPTLFKMLDTSIAGSVAGQLFSIMSYLGLVCGGLLLMSLVYQHQTQFIKSWRAWLLISMLLFVLAGEFIIAPEIRAIREAGMVDADKSRFGMLHGSASILFLLTSLMGLVLVIFGLRNRDN